VQAAGGAGPGTRHTVPARAGAALCGCCAATMLYVGSTGGLGRVLIFGECSYRALITVNMERVVAHKPYPFCCHFSCGRAPPDRHSVCIEALGSLGVWYSFVAVDVDDFGNFLRCTHLYADRCLWVPCNRYSEFLNEDCKGVGNAQGVRKWLMPAHKRQGLTPDAGTNEKFNFRTCSD